jgi:hypothetical protein
MEDSREEDADPKDMIKPALKLSDGVFSNWRSRNSSKKTRREMVLKLTLEFFLTKVAELLTELPLSILRTENDCILFNSLTVSKLD